MRKAILLGCAMAGFACAGSAVLYEGARLIIGDASAPIDNGAFVVENGHITAIGVRGTIKAPAGATRVDLAGKTVMPALNNVHLHIGYEGFVSWGPENHTVENVLDHLEREAFYGVGAVMTMGDQPEDFALKFQRDQKAGKFPAAARFFFAAGLAPPGGGPDAVLIQGTNALHAIREVATPEQAVEAVRQIAAKKIPQLKFWVDERDNTRGGLKKLSPEIYSAIIAEAHRHGITVHAHAITLADQKGVVKAGVDVLVHTVGNEKIDDEFIALLKEKKPYWAPVMGLGDTADLCDDPNPFVEQSMPDRVVADVRAGKTWLRSNPCSAAPNTRRDDILKYNFSQMVAAGARIVLGSDAGVSAKYAYGFAEHHEIAMYVRYGMSPAEAIRVSTSRPAEVLRIPDAGTLRKGAWANFVVLDANPLENIRHTRSIDSVYLEGTKLNRAELQARFKRAEIDRDAYQAKTKKDYVPHPPALLRNP